jgi:hypothetical protein
VPDEWINEVLAKIVHSTGNRFLLQSKNPERFLDFAEYLMPFKDKIVFGTTIETNRESPWSKAPATKIRHECMSYVHTFGFDTFLSMEPIADFDMKTMLLWVEDIQPKAVEIGYENYTSYLPKPMIEKLQVLYDRLMIMKIPVVLKANLTDRIRPSETEASNQTREAQDTTHLLTTILRKHNVPIEFADTGGVLIGWVPDECRSELESAGFEFEAR